MRVLKQLIVCIVLAGLAAPSFAQEIAGDWMGKMNTGLEHPTALVVKKGKGGALTGQHYLLDQGIHPTDLTEVRFTEHVLTFKQGGYPYRGELSTDGQHIVGILELGPRHVPLTFERSKPGAWKQPEIPHTNTTVTVDDGVKLEVLDFGGSGPPLLFLAGLGADAHVFDSFAPRFTAKHHVYSLTRRGFGASDRPDPGKASYDADRLANDVVHAIKALKLDKPALVGWSIAGQELSGIALRAPETIAGRIYLESGYDYALYTPGQAALLGSNAFGDINDMREKLRKAYASSTDPAEAAAMLDELLARNLPELKADLEASRSEFRAMPAAPARPSAPAAPQRTLSPAERINQAILEGPRKFAAEKGPVLAIYALPGFVAPNASEAQRETTRRGSAIREASAKAFEAAYPDARVVRVANAQHNVFSSNPEEVFREMDAFLDKLPR